MMFEKSDLINRTRCVYSREIRLLFLTQNTGTGQVKNKGTNREKLKFGCIFNKGKAFTKVKNFVFTA